MQPSVPVAPQMALVELLAVPSVYDVQHSRELGLEIITTSSDDWEPVEPDAVIRLDHVFSGVTAYRIHRPGLLGWYEWLYPFTGDPVPPHCEMRELMVDFPDADVLMWRAGTTIEPPLHATAWLYRSPYGRDGVFSWQEADASRRGTLQFRVFHPAP